MPKNERWLESTRQWQGWWWEDLSHDLLEDKLAMGLQAAEAKPREESTSYQTWEQAACWQLRTQTWQLWVRSQLPLCCPRASTLPLLWTGGESAALWVLLLPLLQQAPLEMALAPKNYFCTVSQHCSSCLTLRLLFLLAVFWTNLGCGHLCLGCWHRVRAQHSGWGISMPLQAPVKPLPAAKRPPLLVPS